MKPHPFRKFIVTPLLASAVLYASHSQAAILYYDGGTVDILTDGNSAASATTGNWNTTLLNWDAGPSAHVAWNNANNDTAFFNAGTAFAAPTPGTVTLTEAITAGGIIFNTSGYTISGSTLTLGGTNNTIALNNLATAATISSAIGTSAANMTFTAQNPIGVATTTFGAAGGWTGTTTVNSGLTLQLNGASTALLNSSGITLNGGTINQNYNAVADRINDTAAITSNGGTLSTLNPNSAILATETIGAVTLTRGLTAFVHSASPASLTSQTLSLTSLTRSGATNTSAVNFASSGGLNITKNIIVVTGAAATPAGQIVGPWATTGNTSGANDYATYDASSRVVPAAIPATAEGSWTTPANAFTMNAGAGVTAGSAGLTGTRTITALRNSSVTTAVTADSSTDEITLASHAYANGDALIFGGTAVPAGLTAGTLYYVRDKATDVFKVAATSGGAAIDLTSNGTAVTSTGALTLNAGANLETYGLLNGSANTLNVAPGTGGSLTTPTGGGYLNLTAGNGTTGAPINVAAPIINNGTVSVVKSGLGTLNLTGTNTFTGGIVVNSGSVVVTPSAANGFVIGAAGADIINGGNLTYSSANAWGVTGRDVTFNGTGSLTSTPAYTGGTLTVNAGANAQLSHAGALSCATTTGTGNIISTPTANVALNLGNASGFTGNVQNRGNAGGTSAGVQFSSLGDGGALQFAGGNGDGNQAATFTYNGSGALSFGTRQIQILERVSNNNDFRDNILANNSADAAHTWTINTDLLATAGRAGSFNATGTAFLILSGTNTGNNAFNGVISDGQYGQGANGNIGLTKSGTGATSKWILGGNNTYSGPTSVSVGILNIQHANALGSTAVGTTVANAAKLELQGGITTAAEALTLTPGTGGNAMLLNVSGNNIWSGSITSNTVTSSQVSRIQSDLNKLTMSGAVNLTGSAHQLVFQGNGDMEISGQITGVGRITSSATGAGVRTVSNDTNSYTGAVNVNGGTLAFTSIDIVGAASSSLGAPVLADATISIGGTATAGTLRYTGTAIGGHTSDRVINLAGTTGGATIEANGSGPLVLAATNTATGAGIKTLTLSGTNAGNNAIGAIVNNSVTNTTAVTKSGAGTWILTGTNTYTGTTSVSGGTLKLGADNVLADTTNVSIGSATLDAVTFDDTVGTLDAAGSAVINLGAGASLAFADSSAVDWTDVIGALNITGTFVSGSSIRFGTTNTGLIPAQLAVISVNGSGAGTYSLDVNGYLVSGGAPVGYAAWQAANGTLGGRDQDHDGDGVDNGTEHFIYGTVANSGFTALPGVTNTLGTLSVTWTKAASYTGTYGSGFVVETSATLTGIWTTEIADPTLGFTVTFPTANEVKFTFPNPLGTKNFARLKVTGP